MPAGYSRDEADGPALRGTRASSPRVSYRYGTDGDRGRVEGLNNFGKTPRDDTDDTNRGFGDTRTIRWTVKMTHSEIFQMSLMSRLLLVQVIF
jgi:hypothetical protein